MILSRYLSTVLQPLTNESRHKVQSTKDFIGTIKTVQIPDDYKRVSFDVKSLFTSIPLQLALDCAETAITNSTHKLPLSKDDYVDDTFTAVHKDEIDFLHEHLNKQDTYIQFTRKIEENGKIHFLDCLVSRGNNKLRTMIYRKPTNTDRLLDQCSYHPTCHKATAVRTLTRP